MQPSEFYAMDEAEAEAWSEELLSLVQLENEKIDERLKSGRSTSSFPDPTSVGGSPQLPNWI